jgi:predicted metal-dependent enzyme (double-stranded beta helix superfamily)
MGTTRTRPGSGGTLGDLVAGIGGLAAHGSPDPEEVAALVAGALAGDWLDDRYQRCADGRDWELHTLHRAADGRWSMLAAVFRPGVVAPVHDHGTWAVVGVYRGRERETRYRRLDDGREPGRARLEVERTLVSPAGTVTIVPDGAIHTVEALDGRPAVSLHVYGTDIVTTPRSTYDLARGRVEPFRPDFTGPAPR